jgi:hypothetical protein
MLGLESCCAVIYSLSRDRTKIDQLRITEFYYTFHYTSESSFQSIKYSFLRDSQILFMSLTLCHFYNVKYLLCTNLLLVSNVILS